MGKKFVLSCSRPGIRRNGVAHEAVKTYDRSDWTDEQWAIFEADPAFTITTLDEGEGLSKSEVTAGLQALHKAHADEVAKIKADQDNLIEAHGKAIAARDAEISKLSARIAELETKAADQAKAPAKK